MKIPLIMWLKHWTVKHWLILCYKFKVCQLKRAFINNLMRKKYFGFVYIKYLHPPLLTLSRSRLCVICGGIAQCIISLLSGILLLIGESLAFPVCVIQICPYEKDNYNLSIPRDTGRADVTSLPWTPDARQKKLKFLSSILEWHI